MGVANTLSTITVAPAFLAMSHTAAISITSSIGLDGVSRNTHFVSRVMASLHAVRSLPSTRVVFIPNRGRMLVTIWKHDPNSARDETRWSPALTWQAIAPNTAAMPLAVP